MSKKRAFISFDYDNDKDIKDALVAQAKNPDSPFDIVDVSIKEAIASNWKDAARRKIKNSDVVIVMCGKHTDKASGVAAEIKIAQEEKIDYFLLAGHGDESVKPGNAYKSDKMHKWTWATLKDLINGSR